MMSGMKGWKDSRLKSSVKIKQDRFSDEDEEYFGNYSIPI
jgi:hypothetical protein